MSRQCPKCGILDSEARFVGNFCEQCYLSMNAPSLPARITIYVCRDCGAYRFGKRWSESLHGLNDEIALSLKNKKLGIPKVRISDDMDYVRVEYESMDKIYKIPLRVKQSLCDICSRKLSGYYEAIIQLRGGYVNDKFIDKLLRNLEKNTFISKIVKLKEGIDVYCGDKKAVSSVLSSMKLKPKISHTLYGINKGRKVYRTTFLLKK